MPQRRPTCLVIDLSETVMPQRSGTLSSLPEKIKVFIIPTVRLHDRSRVTCEAFFLKFV